MRRFNILKLALYALLASGAIIAWGDAPVRNSDLHIVTLNTTDINGNPPASDSTLLYNKRRCDPAVPNAILAPDGHHITWGEYRAVRGTASVKCVEQGTHVVIHLSGLIPNHTYTIWYLSFRPPGFDGTLVNLAGVGSLGANDGTENEFHSSASGEGQISVIMPGGPLSVRGEAEDCLLDAFEFHLVGAYHLDQKTNGKVPGAPCTFVEQFGFIFKP